MRRVRFQPHLRIVVPLAGRSDLAEETKHRHLRARHARRGSDRATLDQGGDDAGASFGIETIHAEPYMLEGLRNKEHEIGF